MRDPAEFTTKKGTPFIMVVSRVAFALYFVGACYLLLANTFPESKLNFVWVLYLLVLYCIAERFYAVFRMRNIDLSFAFPLLLAIYLLNLASLILGGQEKLPLMNRIEHFASFVLLAYVISVFFSEYLPQNVWINHPYYTALLILSLTALFGVANEIIELLFDTLFHTTHVGPGYDTSLDLLMNTLGSGLVLAVRLIRQAE